jgi:HEAT repeat protein
MAFTTQEREQLKSYIELCDRLERHSFFVGVEQITISIDRAGGTHQIGGYQEETLKSFLVDFRLTYMSGETTFFHSIGNVISRRKRELAPTVKKLKKRYEDELKKAKSLSSDPKIDIVDAFINGKYFHTGEEAKSDVLIDEYQLKKSAFLMALINLTGINLELCSLAKMVFSKKPLPKYPQRKVNDLKKLRSEKKNNEIAYVLSKIQKDLPKQVVLEDFEKARLFLFASAILYDKRLKTEIIGNHELHLAYSFKEKITGSLEELWLIFRTLVSDSDDLKTGWYWLSHLKSKFALEFIQNMLLRDESESVKYGAVSFLDRFWNRKYHSELKILATNEAKSIRRLVLKTLENHYSKDNLEIIEVLIKDSDSDIQKSAFELLVNTLTKCNPHKALEVILKKEKSDTYHFENLDGLIKKQTKTELIKLTNSTEKAVRIFAYKELIKRKCLTEASLEKLLEDNQWEIRYFALQNLIEKGKDYSSSIIEKILKEEGDVKSFRDNYGYGFYKLKTEDLISEVYDKKSFKELEELLEWSSSDGTLIYEILGIRFFDKWKKIVYEDLRDNFTKRKGILMERGAKRLNVPVKKLEEVFSKYDDFIIGQFKTSAYRILLEKGGAKILPQVRDLIETDDYKLRRICIQILNKYGSQKDSQFLFNLAFKKEYTSHKDLTIISALNLDKKGKYKILEQLLKSDEASFIKVAIAFAQKNKKKLDDEKIFSLLDFKDDQTRVLTVAYIDAHTNKKEKEEIIKKMYTQSHYYYNAICWLDRLVYSPSKFQEFYKEELKKTLQREMDSLDIKEDNSSIGRFLSRRYIPRYSK